MTANLILEQIFDNFTGGQKETISESVRTDLKKVYPNDFSSWKDPKNLLNTLLKIGNQTNHIQEAEQLVEDIQDRLDILTHKLKFIAPEHRSKVLYLQDINPVIETPDPYLDKLIRIAGGIPHPIGSQHHLNPNIIIIVSDKNIAQVLTEIPNVFSTGIWKEMDAVKNNRIYIIHNSLYLRNGGVLLPEDAEILAEIINPGYFIFGRDEDVWMNFSI